MADREVRLPDHLARNLRVSSTRELILALTEVYIAAAIDLFGCQYKDILAEGPCVTIGEYLKKRETKRVLDHETVSVIKNQEHIREGAHFQDPRKGNDNDWKCKWKFS